MKSLKEIKTEYNLFIKNIPLFLHKVTHILCVNELTFTSEEIDNVRDLYQNNFQNPEALGLDSNTLKYIFCAYCGEAFMKFKGGNWDLSLLKKDSCYGTPIIVNYGKPNEPWVRVSIYDWMWRIENDKFRGNLSDAIQK